MLENRSFNHLFGRFPGARNTTRVGAREGREVQLIRAPDWLPSDFPHDRPASLASIDHGKMDGFALTEIAATYAYSQYAPEDVPNWWHWARRFVLCDNFFASASTASFPNHLYMIAGTSGGAFDNPVQSPKVLDVRRNKGLAKTWGCDAPEGAYVTLYSYETGQKVETTRPCFTFETQGEQLSAQGIDWAFYAADEDENGYIWNAYSAVDAVRNTRLWDDHIRSVDHLVADIRGERLPSVTWVTPRYEFSNHPPYSTAWAQNWVTQVVNAIMRSRMWEHTAIFVTWDEWGGTYDPVEPARVDALGLGIRVPMLVISPWVNSGMIDHEQGEFCSAHKFIASNWGLPYLSDRVKRTHDFEHVFDFKRRRPNLLSPDPLPLVPSGPLPSEPPADNVGWPPAISFP